MLEVEFIGQDGRTAIRSGYNGLPPHVASISAIPTIFTPDAFPSTTQFILAWDSHQICWLAYPVAWVHTWRLVPVAEECLKLNNPQGQIG